MDDMFAGVAADYDSMFPRDFTEDGRLLARLFKGHNVRTVLDCACGTGPHVAMLAREGYEVTGSDISGSMLELARRRQDEEGFDARFVQAAWEELPDAIDGRFDAVICIGNSLPLAGDDASVLAALEGMYEMVSDGGVLVVQNRNMDKMSVERPNAILNEADGDGAYTLFLFEYRDGMVIYKIFYLVTGSEHDATYGEFPMNLLTRAKLEDMLKQVGARSWKFYGDSFLASFSRTRSLRVVLAAYR